MDKMQDFERKEFLELYETVAEKTSSKTDACLNATARRRDGAVRGVSDVSKNLSTDRKCRCFCREHDHHLGLNKVF